MTMAKIGLKMLLASVAALGILTSTAWAQQTMTGLVTMLDRLNGTIAIQQTQDGTVGANAGGVIEQYKVQDIPLLDNIHAGDKVSFSVAENHGFKAITNLQKQK